MVERQNVLSMNMLKNVKLSNENVSSHMATPEICWARNLSSNLRIFLHKENYIRSSNNKTIY